MVQVRLPGNVQKPGVTYTIIGLTVVVYLLQLLSQKILGQNIDLPFIYGGKINSLILQGQLWRLITPVLLHGSLLHIGFNMYALFSIGPSLEKAYGHGRFLLLYLLGGFAGNTISFLLSPNASIGASTAIFALVIAEAVFIFRNRQMFGGRARNMLFNLGLIIVVNLVIGLNPGIDNWGHLGGLLGGALFSWTAGPVYQLGVGSSGYELQDKHGRQETLWGAVLTFGVFAAIVIGRMLAG
jgi:rhomboid protease GluP